LTPASKHSLPSFWATASLFNERTRNRRYRPEILLALYDDSVSEPDSADNPIKADDPQNLVGTLNNTREPKRSRL
jgi:hypothetical protein